MKINGHDRVKWRQMLEPETLICHTTDYLIMQKIILNAEYYHCQGIIGELLNTKVVLKMKEF